MPLTVIIAPHNTEGEHTLGLDHTAQQIDLLILGVLLNDGLQRGQNLFDGLHELRLVAVLGLYALEHACQISIHKNCLLKYVPIRNVYMTGSHVPFVMMITPIPALNKCFLMKMYLNRCKKNTTFFVQSANRSWTSRKISRQAVLWGI